MNCSSCGATLPQGANICPRCGTATPGYISTIGANEPTIASAYNKTPPPPSTDYGSNPYSYTPPPPYTDPYSQPQSRPYPPPDRKRRSPAMLIIGIVAILVILFGAGTLFLINQNNAAHLAQQQATGTANTALKNATSTAITQNNVAATATASSQNSTADPYLAGQGNLVVNDPMHDNGQGYGWDESTVNAKGGGTGTCSFKNNAYHISRSQAGSLICPAKAADLIFTNVVCEAKMTINQGGDYIGIAFRMDRVKGTGYVFVVGAASDYAVDTFDFSAPTNHEYKVLSKGNNPAIKRGWNQTNVIAVAANGPNITVYVNNQSVATVQDSTYTQGSLGVYGYGQTGFDITITGVRAWKL